MSTFIFKRADKHRTVLTSSTMCPIVRYIELKMYWNTLYWRNDPPVIGTSAISCGHGSVILSRLSVGEIVREFLQPSKQRERTTCNVRFDSQWRRFCNRLSSILMIDDIKEIIGNRWKYGSCIFYYVKTKKKKKPISNGKFWIMIVHLSNFRMFEGEIGFVVCYDDCGYVFYASNGI